MLKAVVLVYLVLLRAPTFRSAPPPILHFISLPSTLLYRPSFNSFLPFVVFLRHALVLNQKNVLSKGGLCAKMERRGEPLSPQNFETVPRSSSAYCDSKPSFIHGSPGASSGGQQLILASLALLWLGRGTEEAIQIDLPSEKSPEGPALT